MENQPNTPQSPLTINKFVGNYLWIWDLIITAIFLLSKGWIGVFMIWFSPLIVALFFAQKAWYKSVYKLVLSGAAPRYLSLIVALHALAFNIFYICMSGFGDTDKGNVFAFGYITTTSHSSLAAVSTFISEKAFLIGVALTIYVLALYVAAKTNKLSQKPQA